MSVDEEEPNSQVNEMISSADDIRADSLPDARLTSMTSMHPSQDVTPSSDMPKASSVPATPGTITSEAAEDTGRVDAQENKATESQDFQSSTSQAQPNEQAQPQVSPHPLLSRHLFPIPDSSQRFIYLQYGTVAPKKHTIIYIHGFPSSPSEINPWIASLPQTPPFADICIIAPTRALPVLPTDTFQSFSNHLLSLLTALDIQIVSLLAISGGAPYALAALHSSSPSDLRSRIRSAAFVSPMLPPTISISTSEGATTRPFTKSEYLPFAARMMFSIASWTPYLTSWLFDIELGTAARSSDSTGLENMFSRRMANRPAADIAAFERGDVKHALVEALREAFTTYQSSDGVALEAALFGREWGFDLLDVQSIEEGQKNKIAIWHGAEDVTVPVSLAIAAARQIGQETWQGLMRMRKEVELHIMQTEGHLSVVVNHGVEIMRRLLEAAVVGGDTGNEEQANKEEMSYDMKTEHSR